MNEEIQYRQPFSVERAIQELHIKRKEILSLPAEKALDEILEHPQPHALVHSFPEEDFYFLIHDIGVGDSVELLSLASARQWEYIVDIEVWERDRISMNSVTKWFDLLIKADPKRLVKWFLEEKIEFVEFYMFKNIEVIVREHDQDPSDFGDGFFTFDDVFYLKLIDNPYDYEIEDKELRDAFLSEFLHHLATYDHVTYQNVLLEFSTVLSAESEEEAYRLRNVRLAEKGFMPFDEAIGIYQPLKPEAFGKPHSLKRLGFSVSEQGNSVLPPVPFYAVAMLKEDNLFTHALQVIRTEAILHQLQGEFAGLCNQVISADQKKSGSGRN